MNTTQKRFIGILLVVLMLTMNVSTVFAGTTYPLLKYGSKGTAVIKLQKALITTGYLKGAADGVYGYKTKSAVVKFQTAKKIRIDGIAGTRTQTLLYAQIAKKTASSNSTLSATASRSSTSSAAATDLYWLSRIIHAEAEAEPYDGKVAVGNVVMNRVNSPLFPNTVKGVIFEYYQGIPQFSPVADGSIYETPCQDSIKAAQEALNGARPVGASTYFFNPDKSAGEWIVANKTFVMEIGDHAFYK